MASGAKDFLPILFAVLAGFVALNILINFVLLYIRRQRINLLLCLFWPLVLLVFLLQSRFQEGFLTVTLAYSVSLLPGTLMSYIGFELIGIKFPWRRYLLLYLPTYPLTFWLAGSGYRFEAIAMPFALATAAPVVHMSWRMLAVDRHHSTKLQKLMGVIGVGMGVHCINFALFRMHPGAQLWGWIVSYAIYDALAIILPSIALENAYLTERERLEKRIRERTADLDRSLDENRALLKLLLHDIRNPLSSMGLYLQAWLPADKEGRQVACALRTVHANVEEIVGAVKGRGQVPFPPGTVDPQDCCQELHALFARSLEAKQLKLVCRFTLPPGTRVRMDHGLFLHSVLGNLVDNALKFSPRGGTITVAAREEGGRVSVEVRDEGEGIPRGSIQRLQEGQALASTPGSAGETGSGMGLSIVRSLLQSHGGTLEFEVESPSGPSSRARGTTARIIIARETACAESAPLLPSHPRVEAGAAVNAPAKPYG